MTTPTPAPTPAPETKHDGREVTLRLENVHTFYGSRR